MTLQTQNVQPITRGYPYAFRAQVTGDGPTFPVGGAFRAEIRQHVEAADLAGAFSTAAGTLVRISDDTIEVRMPPAVTAKLANTTAVIDFVRCDTTPETYLGVLVILPVRAPVTRPVAA